MSDNDAQFNVLIKYLQDPTQARAAVKELNEIKKTTKEVGEEGVKQEKAVEEATKKTFASKKDLKSILKQLGQEFPLLGQVGRLALNPVALAAAGITSAFVIWRKRVDELTKSLGGVELPDVTETQVQRANRHAEALERQAAAVARLGESVKQLKSDIGEDAAVWRALGADLGTVPEQMQAEADVAGAETALASGRSKMRAGSRISPAELKRLEEMAIAAEATKKQAQGRIEQVNFMQSMGIFDPRRLYYDNVFFTRYGRSSYGEARAMEQRTIDQSDAAIGRYDTARRRSALYQVGTAEVEKAGDLAASGKSGFARVAATEAGQLRAAAQEFERASLTELLPSMLKVVREFNETAKALEREAEVQRMRNNIQSQRQ